jgi:uncharacterized protein DUF397
MNTDLSLTGAEWIKSSYSQGDGGQCVEFSPSFTETGSVPVRDSKKPAPTLITSTASWMAFVEHVKG